MLVTSLMSHFALANATSTMADYVSISNSWCTGVNTHKFTKASLSSCASACSKAKCACFAYRATSSSAPRDNCKYVTDLDFRGTSKSKAGFTAYERRGIQVRSSSRGSGSGPIAAGAASGGFCRFDDLSLLRPAERTPTTPPFYLFLPSSIDERALSDCVTRRTGAPVEYDAGPCVLGERIVEAASGASDESRVSGGNLRCAICSAVYRRGRL